MDFVHDQLATGKKISELTMVETFSRHVPALEPRFSYRAQDVVRTLEQICPVIGYPRTIRVDQGRFRVPGSRPVGLHGGVTLDSSRPGIERELVEKQSLIDLTRPHHRFRLPFIYRSESTKRPAFNR
jgi:hypothetical protein